jgi:hypothetical protein
MGLNNKVGLLLLGEMAPADIQGDNPGDWIATVNLCRQDGAACNFRPRSLHRLNAVPAINQPQTGELAFMAGALLMLANWPWTLLAIMPTNNILIATDLAAADADTRALIVKWNRLHAVRTVLGALAVLTFLFAVSAG